MTLILKNTESRDLWESVATFYQSWVLALEHSQPPPNMHPWPNAGFFQWGTKPGKFNWGYQNDASGAVSEV